MGKGFAVSGTGTLKTIGSGFFRSIDPWAQESIIKPADVAGSDQFGYSISMSGDKLAVGARYDDDSGSNAGAVYTFQWNGSAWVEVIKLKPAGTSDEFGWSVSMSGDKLAVGAYKDDPKGFNSGAVYTFQWNGTTWVQGSTLIPNDLGLSDNFGYSVSMSGDHLAVGSRNDDDIVSNAGAVYTFKWDGSAWVQGDKLTPSETKNGDNFGESVSISGDKLAVGARYDDDIASNTGAVYTFKWNGTNWIQGDLLTPNELVQADQFGYSVSMSGDHLVVGAPYNNTNGRLFIGVAYTFKWDGTNWIQGDILKPLSLVSGDLFGWSVSIFDDKMAVGSRGNDDNGSDSGAVYTFKWDGTTWEQETVLKPSTLNSSDLFGHSVSISGVKLAVGAIGNSGTVYTFNY